MLLGPAPPPHTRAHAHTDTRTNAHATPPSHGLRPTLPTFQPTFLPQSAPELFTSIVGVFLAESDVGFGTIVGSAVFNVLFVIGLCAAASSVPLKLTWWPLFRDCSYYIFGLTVLSIFCYDSVIELYEAIILFAMYIGYCLIM